ncbi:dual specificity protein phosphatase 5 isoform X1 [Ornithorhynchus anatinus]|uniref:dual specificity protein phosphatase 5 isoform X1 n=1 Tax=Ornithorhynchus anatinus TaxID=9258 RepID=UPI0010A7FBE1|nr:dual specificity protein phosphatase 5 isoform X1 [Ornithorhynchus anatinus]
MASGERNPRLRGDASAGRGGREAVQRQGPGPRTHPLPSPLVPGFIQSPPAAPAAPPPPRPCPAATGPVPRLGRMKVTSLDGRQLRKLLRKEAAGCLVLDCRPYLAFAASCVRGSLNVNLNSVVIRRARGGPVPVRFVVPDEAARARLLQEDGPGVAAVIVLDQSTRHWQKLRKDSTAQIVLSTLLSSLPAAPKVCFLRALTSLPAYPPLLFFFLSSSRPTSPCLTPFLAQEPLQDPSFPPRSIKQRYLELQHCPPPWPGGRGGMEERKLEMIATEFTHLEKGGYETFYSQYPECCVDVKPISQEKSETEKNLINHCERQNISHKPAYDQGGPVEILPFLYLGSAYHASKCEFLANLHITALLNVSRKSSESCTEQYHYKWIPVEDNHMADISSHFQEAIDFIDCVRRTGGKILVHCEAGISRSPTICMAYLMKTKKFRLEEAFDYIKQRRSMISPNFGFMGQLLQYESEILSSTPNPPVASCKREAVSFFAEELTLSQGFEGSCYTFPTSVLTTVPIRSPVHQLKLSPIAASSSC